MKRVASVTSLIVLLVGAIGLLALYAGRGGASTEAAAFPHGITDAELRASDPGSLPTGSGVRRLPELAIGVPRQVDFAVDEGTLADLTLRERTDQYLDWLLVTAVATVEPSLETFNQVLFDLPVIRNGYMHSLGTFEYGRTRSRLVDDNTVLVLVPGAVTDLERKDLVAQVADEQRKNLGGMFRRMTVIEYALDAERGTATLTRRADIGAGELFTPEFGYFEQDVASTADLAQFMSKVDDLTSVSKSGIGLRLGGRKILARSYRALTVQHVATVWQSEQRIQQALDAWGARTQRLIDDFDKRWSDRTYRTQSELAALERGRKQLEEQIARSRRDLRMSNGSGFSLDPDYDYANLKTDFAAAARRLKGMQADGKPVLTEAGEQKIETALNNKDVVPFLRLMNDLNDGDSVEAIRIINEVDAKHHYQAARYDGFLQGTEVGMVLFYTDLLAKLWVINFLESAPIRDVPDFTDGTHARLAAMYEEEARQLPDGRLWFGYSNLGFQAGSENQMLLLARNATRIYAASSNSLNPGVEVQTSAWLLAPLDWWNDHYEDVAEFEPEYERLNQIMKWSIVIGWLNEAHDGGRLGFLEHVEVNRSNLFPAWVAAHPDLRFTNWSSVGFYPPGAKGAATETMPILTGPTFFSNGSPYLLFGGVSLGDAHIFAARAPITRELESTRVLRSNLDYAASSNDGRVLKTLDGNEFRLLQLAEDRGSLVVRGKADLKLRGGSAQLAKSDVERVTVAQRQGLRMEMKAGDTPIGDLDITTTTNGFKLGWQARELDAGQALARRLSAAADPESVLLDPQITDVIRFPKSWEYAVKLKEAGHWLRFAPEDAPRADIAPGWQLRAADRFRARRTMQVAVLDDGQLQTQLLKEGQLVVDADHSTMTLVPREQPPAGTRIANIEMDGRRITGWLEQDNAKLHIVGVEPPEPADLARLTRRFGPKELKAIRQAAANDNAPVVRLPDASPAQMQLPVDLERGNFRQSATDITSNPVLARETIERSTAAELRRNRRILAERGPNQALAHMDMLIASYGKRPEMMIRRGLIQIERGNAEAAAQDVRFAKSHRANADRNAFFDELNERLSADRAPMDEAARDRERFDMVRYAEYVDWVDQLSADLGDQIHPTIDQNRFAIELHIAANPDLERLSVADLGTVKDDGTVVYRQGTASLNGIDWNAPIGQSLQQIVSGRMGQVIRLPRQDIAHFQPDTIWLPDHPIAFKKVVHAEGHASYHLPANGYRACDLANDPCPEDHADGKQDSNSVYLVMANDGAR